MDMERLQKEMFCYNFLNLINILNILVIEIQKKWIADTGTNIKIISEKQSRDLSPDYYFVLPCILKRNFIKRERYAFKRN